MWLTARLYHSPPRCYIEPMQADLRALRAELDAIDAELLALLARRRAAVRALFALKDAQGIARLDPAREQALLDDRRSQAAALGVPGEVCDEVFRAVLRMSHALP